MNNEQKRTCEGPCGLELEMGSFGPNKKYKDKTSRVCLDCKREKEKRWNNHSPKYRREWRRAWKIKDPEAYEKNEFKFRMRKYGLTAQQYEEMVVAQNGRCAVCLQPPAATNSKNQRLFVDHDHDTNEVRGLLCHGCNATLGLMRDRHDWLVRASLYLQKIPVHTGFHVVVPQPTPPPERRHEICPFPEFLISEAAM